MKPPARKRNKPDRNLNTEPPQSEPAGTCQWQRFEQNNLLKALKTIYRFNGGNRDIDYNYLKKHVPTRSIPEIQSVVEYLKSSVLSLASTKLKKRRWEEKFLKPIELWTSMASTLAGTHEEPISAAFSQMLIVSSTEPCTLRNSDPPQDPRSLTNRPVGRTVPLRPMPQGPVKVTHPGTNAARPVVVLKTPGPAMCPAPSQVVRGMNGKVPPPQQQLSTTAGTSPSSISTSQSGSSSASTSTSQSESLPAGASTSQSGSSPASTSTSQSGILPASTSTSQSGTSPASTSTSQFAVTGHNTPGSGCAVVVNTQSVGSSQIQTPQQPSEQSPTPISSGSTSTSDSPGPHASLYSPASGQTPVPSRAPFSGTSSVPPKAPLSSPAATFHANFGRTNKHFTKDSPRAFGVKSVVDFEKIYCYLSGIHQPNDDLCQLTPMESAIMLDLLMSLPEELPLLDCNKLQKHLLQVYDCLSFTADYEMAEEIFKELKDGLYPREDKRTNQQQSPAAQSPAAQSPAAQSPAAQSPAGGDVAASGGKKLQPDGAENESSGSGIASGQSGPSGEAGGTDLFPALNPFMVPLKLLMRK